MLIDFKIKFNFRVGREKFQNERVKSSNHEFNKIITE